jgi:hypothetical protein
MPSPRWNRVLPVPEGQNISPRTSEKLVKAIVVIAVAIANRIAAISPVEGVIAITTEQGIIANATIDRIVACPPGEAVVAAITEKGEE